MRWILILTLSALPALATPLDTLVTQTRALPEAGDRVALLLRLSRLRPEILLEAQQAAASNPVHLRLVALACVQAQAWPALAQIVAALPAGQRAEVLQQIAATAPERARQGNRTLIPSQNFDKVAPVPGCDEAATCDPTFT